MAGVVAGILGLTNLWGPVCYFAVMALVRPPAPRAPGAPEPLPEGLSVGEAVARSRSPRAHRPLRGDRGRGDGGGGPR